MNILSLRIYAKELFVLKLLHSYVRFEVFTAVTMKNAVFWDVTLCGSCNKPS
jgi:hypothetical protein